MQQLDYCAFIELYGKRISGFHVKDAEFRPSGRVGVYGGYQPWAKRAGRFRSLGDGQVDFKRVFTLLTEAGSTAGRSWNGSAASRAPSRARAKAPRSSPGTSSRPTDVAFDDFAGGSRRDRSEPRRSWAWTDSTRRARHGILETQAADGNGRRRARAPSSAPCTASPPRSISRSSSSPAASRSDPRTPSAPARSSISIRRAAIATYQEMADAEAKLPADQRIDFVSIVTPNVSHFPIAKTFLDAGFHVVCDKPMTYTLDEAAGAGAARREDRSWSSPSRTTTPATRWSATPASCSAPARWGRSARSSSSTCRTS